VDTKQDASGPPPRGRFTIVYLIHEAFRRDLGRLSTALRATGVDAARARQLRGHWGFIDEQLHHHHSVEDDSLWPLVRPKLAERQADLAVLTEMEDQHVTLLPHCEAIDRGFAALIETPGVDASIDLASQLEMLGTTLGTHLDDEELRCFPVIDQALSVSEFESFGKATAKAIGMRGSARFFPWIFDGADAVERNAVLMMPPPPVRFLCQYIWEPRYKRQITPLWSE
jgi:iron-sulfur cluster repair protein YtfE (RIC family)